MLEEMKNYKDNLEKKLSENEIVNWKNELKFFKTRLLNLQIERIIHLIITLVVGLATLLSCYMTAVYKQLPFALLSIILGVLFFFYILYYRKIENFSQSWYKTLEDIKKKI
jgi:hypothetical protein